MGILPRIFAAISGALLLALVAPHTNPWTPSLLPVEGGTVALELGGRIARLPLWAVLLGAVVVAATPWLTRRRRATRPSDVFASRTDRLLFAGCLALLLFSSIPAAARGRGTMTCLLVGAAGLSLLTWGTAPVLASRFDAWLRATLARLRALPVKVLVPAAVLLVVLVAGAGSRFVLGQIPHVVDSAAQMFHAEIFLGGELTAPVPEPEAAFRFTHMIQADRWYSQYPPGHSLLLALGLWIHAAWLIGPLFGGLSVAWIYLAGREAFGDPAGRVALVLAALSPFVWVMSSSHMSHATTLFFLGLFLFGFIRAWNGGSAVAALVAGFAAGFALGIRPLTTVAFVAPFGLYAAAGLIRAIARPGNEAQARRLARISVPALAAFAVPLVALLAFNQWTNGSPFVFGYEALHGSEALLGFGKTGWTGVPHTPWRGLTSTLNNLNGLNQYLFGLPMPALALPLLGFAAIRRTRWDWLLASSVVALVAAHFFYWYQDLTYGPRFLYAAVAPLVLLSARSLTALPAWLERLRPGRRLTGQAGIALAVAFLYGWTILTPQMAGFYSRNYYGANPDIPRAVAAAGPNDAVVLVPDYYYPSVFPLNDPAFEGTVVYARDLGPAGNRELARRFPDRALYRLRSLDRYRLLPYDAESDTGLVAYALEAGVPFELELLSFQLSHLANGSARDHWTGELGPLFRNHDQLWISSPAPGLEAGIVLDAAADETRSLELQVMRSPDSGILEIRMNGALLPPAVDLYSPRVGIERVRVDAVALHAGRNGLLLRVVEKNPAARGFGLGLDSLRLD